MRTIHIIPKITKFHLYTIESVSLALLARRLLLLLLFLLLLLLLGERSEPHTGVFNRDFA